MTKTAATTFCLLFVSCLAAGAQPASPTPPDANDARFSFNRVEDGFLRLDARTGQVALCARRPAGWTCEPVPEARAAFESEIGRLENENAVLKRELASRGLPLPSGVGPGTRSRDLELRLPSDADIDRVVSFMERTWRRLMETIVNFQKDLIKKT